VDNPESVTSQPATLSTPPEQAPAQMDGRLFLDGKAPRPSPKKIRKLFQYCRETGELRWRVSRGSGKAGAIAGTTRPDQYKQISIDGVLHLSHVLIWVGVTGEWPIGEIDHANTDRGDNSWENLRPATRAQQQANQGTRSDSKTGVRGVVRLPSGMYRAAIAKDGVKTVLGTFATLTEGADAYWEAAQEMHGAFARQERLLDDEHHFDALASAGHRPTLSQLRDRSRNWREIQDTIKWLDWLDREMQAIERW